MMWALMRKDLVQHARPLLLFAASGLALPLLFAILSRTEKDGAGYAGLVFGFLGVSAPMLLGQWFIGQEKVKGTFRLLRSLPVSGTRIIVTKYLTSTAICLLLINGVLLAEPTVCRLTGVELVLPPAPVIVWTNIAGMLFIAVSTCLFTVFDARIAAQAIIWGACGLMVCAGLAGKYFSGHLNDALALRVEYATHSVWLALSVWLILAAVSFLIVGLAARAFENTEWCKLEEG